MLANQTKAHTYGDKRDYRKIDIYVKRPNGARYVCSTTWARTCREAVERYAADMNGNRKHYSGFAPSDLYARFA